MHYGVLGMKWESERNLESSGGSGLRSGKRRRRSAKKLMLMCSRKARQGGEGCREGNARSKKQRLKLLKGCPMPRRRQALQAFDNKAERAKNAAERAVRSSR